MRVKKFSQRRVEELLDDVEKWPLLNTQFSGPQMSKGVDAVAYLSGVVLGTSPSLFARIPKGLTDVLAHFCAQRQEGRWYGYGWARDETISTPGEVVLLGTRFEPLEYLPNARALLDVHSDCDDSEALSGCINGLEDRLEKYVVGPRGMRHQLDFFRRYKLPIAGEENHIPFFVRVTIRPDGRAGDRDGLRASEKVLQSFLTGMYRESFAVAVDQVAENRDNPTAHLSWHWLEPPKEQYRGPAVQLGQYDVGSNKLTRSPPLSGVQK